MKSLFRKLFNSLSDIKPRDRDDYFIIFSWMISRRLIYLVIILSGLAGLFLLISFHPLEERLSGSEPVRSYRYDSLPLRFLKGRARILAKDGHIAYVGGVNKGNAEGKGKLYGRDGTVIYEGNFAHSMYNGEGKLYGGDGALRYSGEFEDNLYQGPGTEFWNNGSKEYIGNYEKGLKSGSGKLYNPGGNLIYDGTFSVGVPVFAQLLGKTTEEAGQIYTGKLILYDSGEEFCADMEEINALYKASGGGDSLEGGYRIDQVYVLADSLNFLGEIYQDVGKLRLLMGEPVYQGYTNMELAEAVGIAKLRRKGKVDFADPALVYDSVFKEVFSVSGYEQNYDLYLYVFEYEGLVYSFYCDRKNTVFFMYSMEQV